MRVSFLNRNIKIFSPPSVNGKTPVFGGNSAPEDTFEARIINTKIEGFGNVSGKIYSTFLLKDMLDNPIPAVILQDKYFKKTFYACAKEGEEYKGLVRMSFEDEEDRGNGEHLYISALFGNPENRKYTGAGSELIKLAAKESVKKGYGGRIELVMTGSFPFYHKNNFKTQGDSLIEKKAAALVDYAARHNLNPSLYPIEGWEQEMRLDEDGAKALLCGRKYFDESISETLYHFSHIYTKIDGEKAETSGIIDFSDLRYGKEDGEFALQYLEGDAFDLKQTAIMTMISDAGKKTLTIENFDCIPPSDDIKNESKKSIEEEFIKILKRKFEGYEIKFEH